MFTLLALPVNLILSAMRDSLIEYHTNDTIQTVFLYVDLSIPWILAPRNNTRTFNIGTMFMEDKIRVTRTRFSN